jgi:hypothetical protein
LSQDTEVTINVTLPGVHRLVRLDRARFEEMIRPSVEETVAALGRAIDSAGLPGGVVPTILLAGGSSRIPLVRTLVERELGLPTAVGIDPKGVLALGSALAARDANPAPTNVPSAAVPPPAADAYQPEPAETVPDVLAPPPVAVRPFHQPDTAPSRRLPVVIGAAASGVLALVIGGSLLAYVTQNEPVTPVGSTAEASTPASGSSVVAPPTAAPPAPRPRPREQAPQDARRAVVPTPPAATTTTVPPEEPAAQEETTTAPPEGTTVPPGDVDETPGVAADPEADPESTTSAEETTETVPSNAGENG